MANTTLTWKDIKLATLQKMFAAEGNTIPTDESTTDYLAGMPFVANEALQMIATAGKFIIKSISIAHNTVSNILGETGEKIYQIKDSMSFSGVAYAYYFEFTGIGTVEIYVGDNLYKEIEIPKTRAYEPYKGIIENPNKEEVTLKVSTDYLCAVKSIALYDTKFVDDDDVQSNAENIRYELDKLVPDYYMLDNQPIIFEGTQGKRYLNSSNYFFEGKDTLLLPRNMIGNFIIYYKAYPQEMTTSTPDDYELPLYPEVAALLPLYMASQLYKDDDNGIATGYRNEFEVAFDRLQNRKEGVNSEVITSESGWI